MSEKQDKLDILVVGTGRANMDALVPDAMPTDITDPISATPTLIGEHGRAWLCDMKEGCRKMNINIENEAMLAHWVIEAPWAHPAWHSYSLCLLHLRPLADKRPTTFYLDDATHEIWLMAMNPDKDRNSLIADGITRGHWLSPLNFVAQFIEISDELAFERIRKTVQLVCDGKLSPDTDWIQDWAALFGNNMIKDRPNPKPPTVKR
jgi:hypothetical protein